MQIEVIAFLSFSALLGLIYCIFGSRFFRTIITFTAFIAGLLFTYKIAGIYFTTLAAKASISIAGGFVLALVFNILHHVGRFIAGVLAAACTGVLIIHIFQISKISYVWDALLLLCLIAGISAANKNTMLRAATAFLGAFIITAAGFYFLRGINPLDLTSIKAAKKAVQLLLEAYPYYIAGSVLFFTLAGIFFQFWQSLRFIPNRKKEKKEMSANVLLLPASSEGSRLESARTADGGSYNQSNIKAN